MAAPASNTTPFPKLNSPLVDGNGNITHPWQRLLIALWQKTGGSGTLPNSSTYVAPIGGSNFGVFDAVTGTLLGVITTVSPSGAAAQPVSVSASPFVFTSAGIGTLVMESGQVEISRDHGATYFIGSLTGGFVPLLVGDKVRVTYYNSVPKITFLPTQGL